MEYPQERSSVGAKITRKTALFVHINFILSYLYSMKKKIWTILSHMLVFIIIEILFVFAVLHEFPEVSLFEKLGIVHISYWLILIAAGFWREKLQKYRQKFLATYLPVVYHMLGHIYIWYATIESVEAHSHWDEHSLLWIVLATISLGVLIFVGEWLLHRKTHCDHCHQDAHAHCEDPDKE